MSCFPAAVKKRLDWHVLAAPAWARDLVKRGVVFKARLHDHIIIDGRRTARFSLISARIRDAASMSPAEFEQRTAEAYNLIAMELQRANPKYAVRFWNYIPSIHAPMDDGRDRYMVFNAGRYAAFCKWYGGADRFSANIATASGVGHRGADLVIHCLASDCAGVAVENPRQVPPYQYSKRFGPLPPCFSRATVIPDGDAKRILVGGTASILGEDSMHVSDVGQQMRETLENLSTLLVAAAKSVGKSVSADSALRLFRDLRVYHPNGADGARLRQMLEHSFGHIADVELIEADLCRPELLVEIEGTAGISASIS